ncbi:MAG: STAS domain-containing protein [Ruminococcaceae bacterium]|nr:STAS domain-containing protein [Oscillospiraceae bacterium]
MPVRIEADKNLTTAYLSGEIDHHSCVFIRDEIDATINRLAPLELCLDFMHVSFMDSSGIGLVMGRYKLMHSLGGRVRVRGVSPSTMKVMKLAGLDLLAKIDCKGDIK